MQENKIKVIIVNRQEKVKIETGIKMLLRRCCNAVLKLENFKGLAEISVTLVDNVYIQELNKQYRDKDVPTDVLSFPQIKEGGGYEIDPNNGYQVLGDIIISVETVSHQCKVYGRTFRHEMAHLTAHGALHLLGYDHEKSSVDRMHMREREETILDLLGFPSATTYLN